MAGYLTPALGLSADQVLTADQFPLGEPAVTAFERAVQDSRATVVVLTPAYQSDRWAALAELLSAHRDVVSSDLGARLIPLVREPCDIPLRLDFRVRLDFTDRSRWEAEAARLRNFLHQPVPPPADDIACPYPGLAPFDLRYAEFFHGRDQEIADLRRRVRVQPFTLVAGPSGSGKSSLVLAGLLPRLDDDRDRWLVRTLRPGPAPISALADALGVEPPASVTAWPTSVAPTAVRDLLAGRQPSADRLLLVIDQLEEVFAQAPAASGTAFLEILVGLRAVGACRVVATMRADFYPELMTSPLWPLDAGERVEIAPLRGARLREAVTRPAAEVGVHLDRGLVERLIADAADEPGALPLVQETMAMLWEERDRRLVTLAVYDGLGADGRSGLAVILAVRADGVLSTLSPAQRAVARRILLRLVHPGDGRDDTRRQQPVAALRAADEDPAVFDATLTALLDGRLLNPSGDEMGAGQRVDLAHEALISGWPTLRQWVEAARQDLRVARALSGDAEQWSAGDRDDSDLYRGARLATALEWAGAHNGELNHLEDDFLQASQAHEVSELAAVRRTNRRLGRLARALVVLLVVAVGATGLAWQQSAHARKQAQRAAEQSRASLSRQLAAQAGAAGPSQVSRALLLAVQASLIDDTAEARSALLAALQSTDQRLVGILTDTTTASTATAGTATAGTATTSSTRSGATGARSAPLPPSNAEPVRAVAVSPDGQVLATGSESGAVTWWDSTDRRPRGAPVAGHRGAVQSLSFSPDGTLLVSGSHDGTARLWDVASGRPLGQPLRGGQNAVWATAFSPDGTAVAAGGRADDRPRDGMGAGEQVTVWDVATRQPRDTFAVAGGATVASVGFDRDGGRLLAAALDGAVGVRDLATRQTGSVRAPTGGFSMAALSADGRLLALGTLSGLVELWDVATNRRLFEPLADHRERVDDLAFSPDGRLVAAGSLDQTVIVWDTTTGRMVGTELRGHPSSLESVTFGPDGRTIVSGDDAGTTIQWDLDGGSSDQAPLAGHQAAVWSVAMSPDGSRLATASDDGSAMLWDARSGRQLARLPENVQAQAVAFSPDGRRLAVGTGGGVTLRDATSGHAITSLPTGATGATTALAFSPDGRWLAAGTAEGTGLLWDLATGQPTSRTLPAHNGTVTGLAFGPDGRTLASAGVDGVIYLWDGPTGRSLGTLGQPGGTEVQSLAFDPAGRVLVTGDSDVTFTVWDTDTDGGQPRQAALAAHRGRANAIAVSGDGQLLATGGADGFIVLWRTDGAGRWYRLDEPLRGHTGPVSSITFSPDGRTLVSASFDETARRWDVDPASWRRRACTIANRNLTQAEWSQFVGDDRDYDKTCGFER